MTATCPHRPPCPGCPRFGENTLAPAAVDALAALCDEAGVAMRPPAAGAPFGFRVRARLAVRGRPASPKVGIFQAGSHRIVDIPRCPLHHPRVNEVAAALRRAMAATGTPPYAERAHRGLVRYLQVVVERASGRAQVVVVGNGDDPASLQPVLERLARALGEALHSLWWNGNPARTNAILGPHWACIVGPPAVTERIGGAEVHFPPGAFGQANLDLADRLVEQVAAWVPDGARVVEYHAGCGAIGLGLAARAGTLAMNERSPDALAGLALGIAALPPDVRVRVTVLPGAAAAHAGGMDGADVVIADPPRSGLEPALLDALCRTRPARIVLVGCSLASFLRDGRALRTAGMTLRALQPYVMVPHTEHVEVAALFARA